MSFLPSYSILGIRGAEILLRDYLWGPWSLKRHAFHVIHERFPHQPYKLQHADKKIRSWSHSSGRERAKAPSIIIVFHFPQLNNSIMNSKHAWKEIPWRKSKSNYDMQVEQTTSLSCLKCLLYWKRCSRVHWVGDEENFFKHALAKQLRLPPFYAVQSPRINS